MAHLAVLMQQFPDRFEEVRADRSLLPALVDEVLRYSSSILYFRRTVTAPTTLSGTELHPGDKVVMWYCSANFDDAQFPDPLEFRVDRPSVNPHVAFGGGGAHFCLGASLARLELTELIAAVLDRNLIGLAVGEPEFVESNFVNGIEHLQVTL